MYDPAALQPGDVLLMIESPRESLPARILDRLISLSEANPFVHTCVVGDGNLIDPVWQVERAPLDRYALNGWAFRVQATAAQRMAAVAWAETHVGNAYGIAEVLADFARLDLHWVRPSWYNWRPQHWTCSGFVTASYAAAGVTLTRAPAPAPSDLSFSPLLIGRRPWGAPTGSSRGLHGNPHKEA